MTVSTFYSDASDGYIDCTSAVYATARSGGGTFAVDTTNDGSGFKPFGQASPYGAVTYGVAEAFFSFDTSSIPDTDTIESAVLSLYFFADNTATVTSVCEARLHDWGTSLTSADWVSGAILSSKTRLASKSTAPGSRFSTSAYTDFVSDAAFIANINRTGSTRMVLSTHRVGENNAPTNDETVHPYYVEKGTTFRPKLVVTHTSDEMAIVLTQPSEADSVDALLAVVESYELGQAEEADAALVFAIAAVVTGLTATGVSSTQIDLAWNPFAGATGYDIERDGAVIAEFLPLTETYQDGGLTPNTSYTYRVRAIV